MELDDRLRSVAPAPRPQTPRSRETAPAPRSKTSPRRISKTPKTQDPQDPRPQDLRHLFLLHHCRRGSRGAAPAFARVRPARAHCPPLSSVTVPPRPRRAPSSSSSTRRARASSARAPLSLGPATASPRLHLHPHRRRGFAAVLQPYRPELLEAPRRAEGPAAVLSRNKTRRPGRSRAGPPAAPESGPFSDELRRGRRYQEPSRAPSDEPRVRELESLGVHW